MSAKPILYAEDEEDDVFFMERAFMQAGINDPLVIVSDGQEAVDYLLGVGRFANREAYPFPGLVLLDLKMPKLSGIEVLKRLRETPATVSIPVVMVTSSAQDGDVHRSYQQGANGYLVKPSQPEDLLPLVRSIKDFWLIHNRVVVRK